jgi:Amt family ammonium transporter
LKVPDDDVDEGMSMHSLHHNSAGMAITSHHEKNQESMDSSNQLADWAHRA